MKLNMLGLPCGQPRALWPLVLIAAAVFGPAICASTFADEPRQPNAVNLGPGNEDAVAAFLAAVRNRQPTDLSGRDLRGMRLSLGASVVTNARFDRADLTGAVVGEASFANCTFRGAIVRRTYLPAAIQEDCEMTDADISESSIGLTKRQLTSTVSFKRKDLAGTILHGDFSGASFAEFDLRGTVFDECNLAGCDFTNADIRAATMICRRTSATPPREPVASRFTKEQLYATKSYRTRNLENTLFVACDFRNADFSKQNLGKFVDCDLTGADFTDACFSGSQNRWYLRLMEVRRCGFDGCVLSAEQLYSTWQYKTGTLGASFDLENMDLKGWDFRGMNLPGVSFAGSSIDGIRLENARGGLFEKAKGLTIETVKTTWDWKENKDPRWPGSTLPREIAETIKKERREN